MNFVAKSAVILLFTFVFINMAFAHGLSMTTAEITHRSHNHLTITIRTSIASLFAQMKWQTKPSSLIHLASDQQQLAIFRKELGALFSKRLTVAFHRKPLQSTKVRLPSIRTLTDQIQTEIANNVLSGKHQHDHNDRSNYLVIYIDGFIPKNISKPEIEIAFPTELQEIMVSYTKPKVQTIEAGLQSSFYREKLR